MKSVVYLSEASVDFSTTQLTKLAQHCIINNKVKGITGFLCFVNNTFLQYIEGDDCVVDELIRSIYRDERHNILYEIESCDISEKVFPIWSMRYITTEELQRFNLDHFIEKNLQYIKNNFGYKERCREFVWEHVHTVAQLKPSLLKLNI